jgi:excisionase family DNA binding protein
MDVSVAEAAARLDVDRSRVEQLLRSGRLPGRRAGRIWLIDEAVLADWSARSRASGRPMAPVRAWGMLDLLDGGSADWLPPVARSQVKARIRQLRAAGAGEWRALLRARSDVQFVRVHPAALDQVRAEPAVLGAGAARAASVGAGLVALEPVEEIYVQAADWPRLAKRWHANPLPAGGNLVLRLPRDVWPFEGHDQVGAAVLAADLIESPEPRAVSAGLEMLRDRAKAFS